MRSCIFCQILGGDAPASIVFRDGVCCAFLDIQPVNPGHALVIPVAHAPDLADLDAQVGAHMFTVAQRVAGALRESGIRCEGVNMFLADGIAAGQEVFHVHLHVIPRFSGDRFGLRFGPNYGHRPARAELDDIAASVRSAAAW
jgi:diadenosine tetraphosphate (Ap4A) HIT family hydrolase